MAAPVLESVATASSSTQVGTITINKPSGTVEGDTLIAVVPNRNSSATVTPPDGTWAQIGSTVTASSITLTTWRKLATSSEPASYAFTNGSISRQAAGIARISGASPTAPIDVVQPTTGTAVTSLVAAGVDPSDVDRLLLEVFAFSNGNATITNPAGATSRWSFTCSPTSTAAPVCALASETLSADTPTGTRTATTGAVSGNFAAQLIAIQAAPAATGFTGWGVPI